MFQDASGTTPKATELAVKYESQITGKTVLVTGASPNSIGAAIAIAIASGNPGLLILAGRNAERNEATKSEIVSKFPELNVRTLTLDLASLQAVRDAAAEVKAWTDVPHINVLVHSAGIMGIEWKASPDGYEYQLATNHLGPFLFTNLIMSKLLASPKSRVVVVSSDGHRLNPIRFNDYNFRDGETYDKWLAYGQSKTANNLFALSLAQKLGSRGLHAFSVHPGVVLSNLSTHIDWTTEFDKLKKIDLLLGNAIAFSTGFTLVSHDEGASTPMVAAFEEAIEVHNGSYLSEGRVLDPTVDDGIKPWAISPAEAARLWKLSEKLVGENFEY
ncbi:NAD(P)-binding protein [Xylariaceae sp. FL1272]|nr:NAD(P)-binding protein [Xylariaceae sp. FL1272]